VAERVVDDLETVEIEEQQSGPRPAPQRLYQGALEAVEQECPVRQAGQRVVEGLMPQLFLERLALADVAQDAGEQASVPVLDRGDAQFEREFVPVPVQARQFEDPSENPGRPCARRGNAPVSGVSAAVR